MLSTGAGIYIQIPNESVHRLLHPGRLTDFIDGVYTCTLQEPALPLRPGLSVVVFYEIKNRFMQQPARVEAILESEPSPVIGLMITGDAISAEARQCYRVSTVMTSARAKLGRESECQVLDISATGFAMMSTKQHLLGEVVTAILSFEDLVYQGLARVQSVREMPDGSMRYGLHGIESRDGDSQLIKGQNEIAMAMQRAQLKRLARG